MLHFAMSLPNYKKIASYLGDQAWLLLYSYGGREVQVRRINVILIKVLAKAGNNVHSNPAFQKALY